MEDKLRSGVIVYGPYQAKDGRLRLCLYWKETLDSPKKSQTISYPKWLMEQHLGRCLTIDETVDHINRDFSDNRLENLQIVSKSEHSKLDATRVADMEVGCVWCGVRFLIEGKNLRGRLSKKAGPFCSRTCSGKYGAEIQNDRISNLPKNDITREYYRKNK